MAAQVKLVVGPKTRITVDSDLEESLMKKISSFILTAGALILAASCAQELNVADPTPDNGKEINITVIATDKPAVDEGTKTFIDGTSVKWSDSGEKLKVFEVATPSEGDIVTTSATTAEGVTNDGGNTMSFGVTMDDKSSGSYNSFDYYAVYPSSAYQSGTVVTAIALNTKGAQTPSATNFDASQDLLIAKKIENGASQATILEMQFARVVAIGKMTIKNLETTDPITKITFSAKVGSEAVALAGRTSFNLETAKPVTEYASNTQDYSIILDYEGQNITANSSTGMVAYFTCYPFAINATTPGSFKVVVETATQSFMKEVNVSSAKGLAFNIGKASVFSVDMDGIAGVDKAADLCYAYLVPSDVSLGASYGNVSVKKTHGDSWSMFAINSSGTIGVRRNDDGNNDSYIKLPDFVEDIKTVVVTLNSPSSGKTITLESSATETGGTIAELPTTAATVYTFDLTSGPSVKTAYFRSSGAQAKVEKIEVYAGTDTRSAIAAPASVAAELNSSKVNSIDVSWASVDGAAGYVITLVPDSGDDVVVKVASSPYTVTDLAYEMDYLVSVQAEPADYYLNKISAQTTASDVITTGADSSGEVTLTESDITAGDYTVKGTNSGKLAYRLGTGSNNGSLTFPAGYSSITFTLAGWASGTRSFSITNGTINGKDSLSPDAGSPSGTINADFTTTYTGTEYTIDVTDPTQEVVFSGRRCVVWGFTATTAGPAVTWNLESIAVTTVPTKTTYTEGESFNPAGMVVTGHFVDADDNTNTKDEEVTGYTITPDGALSTTDDHVTITYQGKTATQAITVNPAPAGNDGSLEHPYTASEARALAISGDTGSYYISGIVTKIQNQYSASYGTANFWIDENGTDQTVFEGYKIKYFGNVNWVEGNAEIALNDEVIIYGTLTMYNTTPETSSGYLVSLNGKTKGLTLAAPTVTTNDSAKQITVAWTAATGTESAVSYVINCGTQSYNASDAGSHTFTMADYGTYSVSVEATASDAVSATLSTSAILTDPSSATPYYVKVTDLSTLSANDKVIVINMNHNALPAFTSTGTISESDISSAYDSTNDRFSVTSAVANCAITLKAPTTTVNGKTVFKLFMSNNNYITKTGTSGTGFNPVTTSTDVGGDWTLSMDSNGRVNVKNNYSGSTRCLIWRAGSTNKFGAYASSNVNDSEYYNVYLYKLAN